MGLQSTQVPKNTSGKGLFLSSSTVRSWSSCGPSSPQVLFSTDGLAMFPQPQRQKCQQPVLKLAAHPSPAWQTLCGRLWRPQDGSATPRTGRAIGLLRSEDSPACGAKADLGSFGRRSIDALNFKTTTRKFTACPFLFVLPAAPCLCFFAPFLSSL
jgi:hypothetical protein